MTESKLVQLNFENNSYEVSSIVTVYCKSFEVEKFCGFCGSIDTV